MTKRMFLIPAAFILFILFFTVFGERGLLHIHHLNEERDMLQKQAEALKAENDKLRREIEALKTDHRYLESIARRDFGLVRPNEIVYQFPKTGTAVDPDGPGTAETSRTGDKEATKGATP